MEVQQNQPLPEENCTRFLIVAFVKRPGELKIKESKFDKKYQVGSLGYLIRFTVSMVGIVDQRWCVTLYIKYLYTIVQNPNLPHQVVQVNHQKECGGQFGSRYCEIIIWYIYSDISMHEISIPIILNYIHITLYHSLNPLSIPFVQPLTVVFLFGSFTNLPTKKTAGHSGAYGASCLASRATGTKPWRWRCAICFVTGEGRVKGVTPFRNNERMTGWKIESHEWVDGCFQEVMLIFRGVPLKWFWYYNPEL